MPVGFSSIHSSSFVFTQCHWQCHHRLTPTNGLIPVKRSRPSRISSPLTSPANTVGRTPSTTIVFHHRNHFDIAIQLPRIFLASSTTVQGQPTASLLTDESRRQPSIFATSCNHQQRSSAGPHQLHTRHLPPISMSVDMQPSKTSSDTV